MNQRLTLMIAMLCAITVAFSGIVYLFYLKEPLTQYYADKNQQQKLKDKLIEIVEQRKEEDVFRTFYRLNTVKGITRAAHGAGLRVRECHRLSTSSTGTIVLLGPLVVFDLLLRRMTRWKRLANLRANLVVVLEKP